MISVRTPCTIGRLALLVGLIAGGTGLVACGRAPAAAHLAPAEVDAAPAPEPSGDAAVLGAPCAPGERKTCSIPLPSHGNTHDCYTGTRVCKAGAWSACFGTAPADASTAGTTAPDSGDAPAP
jgi:hypothetical protein